VSDVVPGEPPPEEPREGDAAPAPDEAELEALPTRAPPDEPPAPRAFVRGIAPPPAWRELQRRLRAPAPVTAAVLAGLVAIHVGLFLLELTVRPLGSLENLLSSILAMKLDGPLLERFGAVTPDLFARHEEWRLLTAALLHGGSFHLVANGVSLYAVGRLVERICGRLALAVALVSGAIAASLASALGEAALMVGASGAIFALVGVLATGVRGPELPPGLAPALRRRIVLVAAITFVGGAAWNLLVRKLGSVSAPWRGFPEVSNVAHAGGFAAGLAFGLLLPAPFTAVSPLRARVLRATSALVLASGVALGAWGVTAIARSLEEGSPGSLAVSVLAGGPLRPVEIPRLGIEVEVPEDWMQVEDRPNVASFGPGDGQPLFRLFSFELPRGSLTPRELSDDPDVLAAVGVEELRGAGVRDVRVGPFARVAVGGLEATRIELRYRNGGVALQELRYVARGRGRVYLIQVIGPGTAAEGMAERLMEHVRFAQQTGSER
jgi:membrane associated rhomboid family serine protease